MLKQPIRLLLSRRGLSTTTSNLKPFNNHSNYKSSSNKSSSILSSNRFQEQYNKSKTNNSNHNNKRVPRPSHQNSNHRTSNNHNRFDLQKILETGSESSQNALKSILTKLYNLNTNYQIQQVTDQGLSTCKIHEILKDLNLQKQGIQLIERDDKLPLVKIIKIQEMLKSYNDELAESKELELLKIGSTKTMKILDNKLKSKQKKSSDKQFIIKWNISINDLKNQKFNELEKLLKKNGKFNLYIITNKNISFMNNPNIKDIIKDHDQLNLEIRKRELIKDKIETYLNELTESPLKCKWNLIDGDVNTRLQYGISSVVKPTEINEPKPEIQEIEPIKVQKSQPRQTQQKKIEEDDLDSLYSFKIED
ncbi:AIM23 [Candida jiufengensis]|uniref:AIM23 n=1 Tax=Candida jiufengensis TaxID=497108 RepID=UPI0022254313|nr:AIM23 [Candida jiufengensis]KAI5952536.1 AIM23 [Candida jiufengensis]